MSEYYATIEWQRQNQNFLDRKYSRAHEWQFDGGFTVPASSSPHIVPLPLSVASNVDPEEAFVASISSCHMLFFLDFASRDHLIVDSYTDHAIGTLAKDAHGRLAMTEVILNPNVIFDEEQPDKEHIVSLHDKAHHACFIANSVLTEIKIKV